MSAAAARSSDAPGSCFCTKTRTRVRERSWRLAKPCEPRANSAKGRLKALLKETGSEGLTHVEITEHLTDVAASTLNTYLSVMANGGELERHGDKYRVGAPAAAAQDEGASEDDQEDAENSEAAE